MDMYQKRKIRQERKNSQSNQESFSKVSISCLPCIYTVHYLNPYKMGVFKN